MGSVNLTFFPVHYRISLKSALLLFLVVINIVVGFIVKFIVDAVIVVVRFGFDV